jgi:acyl-coenzyme A thioesterase PaaI-like protein
VHGGFVCALFDQFLGVAQLMTGQPGVTGTLSTRLHLPTPLDTDLTLIGRVKEVKGRKNIMAGEIWANGVMTASCEGLFVHVSKDRFRQLVEANQSPSS